MSYKIDYFESLSEEEDAVANDYWEMEQDRMKYTLAQISVKHNVTHAEIYKAVDKTACTFLAFTCCECSKDIYKATNRNSVLIGALKWSQGKMTCKSCRQKMNDEAEQKFIDTIVDQKPWRDLTPKQFLILRKIAEFDNDLKSIHSIVFNDNPYDKKVWYNIRRIEETGVLYVDRTKSVWTFNIKQDIRNAILSDSYIPVVENKIPTSDIKFIQKKVSRNNYVCDEIPVEYFNNHRGCSFSIVSWIDDNGDIVSTIHVNQEDSNDDVFYETYPSKINNLGFDRDDLLSNKDFSEEAPF